ncbi:DUF4124 domain-containing protein [Thioalkalivibrio sp. XN8]|uniref:DUF4124 domain-containing protein n=1 Tax=Thioalkalivibrio sp. XN8 TaxID=2712863 RepID=UPI0013EA761D|nr:DUF4124 domain-containing protein [Thioalkalivibrio sp. XN8]NGP53417.1 DUF4124 domain-containing protein [Thioalkalivibrio sp. XN8]
MSTNGDFGTGTRPGRRWLAFAAAAVLALAAGDALAAGGKIYRWVDENGKVHFGDAIPPEYSRQQHEIVDPRGVRTIVNEQREPAPARSDRDRALLATYGTVEEIEEIRDRRTGFLDAQNEVARDRLNGLRIRRQELEGSETAVNELATVNQRIGEYEEEIARRSTEIERIRSDFEEDIRRFRELKGLPEAAPAPEATGSL